LAQAIEGSWVTRDTRRKLDENVPITASARQSANAGVVDGSSNTCKTILAGALINILPDTSTSSSDGHLLLANLNIAKFGEVND